MIRVTKKEEKGMSNENSVNWILMYCFLINSKFAVFKTHFLKSEIYMEFA